MALVFHKVHGSNVQLSDDHTDAHRVRKEDNSNGILFSSRPLKVGESLEVRLDGLSLLMQGGGLEIGVTDLDPATLTSDSLPRSATDLDTGRTVMVSGWTVALNGKEIEMIGRNTHDIKPGDTLGLQLDGDSVEILLCGECVSRVNVSRWQHVYGVVDLYGRADAVSITTKPMTTQSTSKLAETKNAIKSMLEKMEQKDIADLQTVRVSVKVAEESYHKFLRERACKQQAAAYLAKLRGGHIITQYLKQLRDWGTDDKVISSVYNDLRSMCWHYAYSSRDLCKQFGEAGLLETCTKELGNMHRTYKRSEASVMMVHTAFGIIHNCAKLPENRVKLRSCGFVTSAKHYTDTSQNAREVVLMSVMAISYVMEPNEANIARLKEATMSAVLDRLQRAIDKDVDKYDGWYAYELCHGLANLAADEVNLKNAVQLSAHSLFGRLLMCASDDQDRLAALHALEAHIRPNSCRVIAGTKGMLPLLDASKEKGSAAVKEKASQVYEKLTTLVRKREQEKGTKTDPSSTAGTRGMFQQRTPVSLEEIGSPMDHLDVKPLATSAKCPFQILCQQFFCSLNLNAEFFNPAFDMCYCKKCHRERKDQDYYHRGSPPKQYGLPIGWCRFALLLPPRAKALDVSKKWHRAFHGTRHKFLSKILEVGELAVPGRDTLGGHRVRELPGHFCDNYKPDGFDTKNIFLSPSINYSGHDAYATPMKWKWQDKQYLTRVAFQVFISPDSYQVGAETIGAKKQLDPKFSNSEIEWYTSQQGSTILYGLLIKVTERP